MFMRVDKLLIELPMPKKQDPNAGAALQELLGGKYGEGRHRWLYTNSPSDYREMAGIWGNGETALPGDPPGELEVVEGVPDGGKIPDLDGMASAFTPEYAPEEMFEIAQKLSAASR